MGDLTSFIHYEENKKKIEKEQRDEKKLRNLRKEAMQLNLRGYSELSVKQLEALVKKHREKAKNNEKEPA